MQKNHDNSIDTLRFISIIAVVVIHTTTRTLEVSHYDLNNHLTTLFFNQASRFAVPLFFLISGFVLELSYRNQNYLTYLKKRLSRILVPYVFWSLIYYFIIYTKHTDNLLISLLNGSASYQLYFIPTLFIFYLIFPLFHKCLNKLKGTKVIIFILIFLGIIQMLILNYDYMNHNSPLFYPVAVFTFNFFVFILGMNFAKWRDKVIQILRKVWPVLLILGTGLAYYVFNEGKTNYLNTYNFEMFYSSWRVSILLYTISVFGVLYYFANKSFLQNKIIYEISQISFFVFFVHVIILEALSKYLYNYGFIFIIAVLFISTLLGYLVHKLKFLVRITG